MTGGFQCGAIRFEVTAPLEDVHICSCRMCQKAAGNLFAALAPVKAQGVAWTRGTPAEFASSSAAVRGFCKDCGTPLYFKYNASDRLALTIGSFDHPAAVRPEIHYGVESRLPWLADVVVGGLREEPTDTDSATLKGAVSHQHPDHA